MPLGEKSLIIKNSSIVSTAMDNEAVLLNIDTGDYYTLNTTGSRVWEMIDGTKTVLDLVEEIVSRFEVSKDKAREDILNLLKELMKENLVELDASS